MIYRVQGNLNVALLMPAYDQSSLSADQLYHFLPERFAAGDCARALPQPVPGWFKFQVLPKDDANGEVCCLDAMGTVAGGFGVETFLSASARARLEPYLGRECEFFEIQLQGAPEPYFAMWVTRVIDALDYERSRSSEARYLPKKGERHPLQLYSYEFRSDRQIEGYLFRLPGRDLSEASMYDYATENFLDLVTSLRITGFEFSKNAQDRPIEPVQFLRAPASKSRH